MRLENLLHFHSNFISTYNWDFHIFYMEKKMKTFMFCYLVKNETVWRQDIALKGVPFWDAPSPYLRAVQQYFNQFLSFFPWEFYSQPLSKYFHEIIILSFFFQLAANLCICFFYFSNITPTHPKTTWYDDLSGKRDKMVLFTVLKELQEDNAKNCLWPCPFILACRHMLG